MANLAEGFERRSTADMVRFWRIAAASIAELRSDLYILSDLDMVSTAKLDQLTQLAGEVARLIKALLKGVEAHLANHSEQTN